MLKIRKGFRTRTITILIIISFLFSNSTYSLPVNRSNNLRVPGNTERVKARLRAVLTKAFAVKHDILRFLSKEEALAHLAELTVNQIPSVLDPTIKMPKDRVGQLIRDGEACIAELKDRTMVVVTLTSPIAFHQEHGMRTVYGIFMSDGTAKIFADETPEFKLSELAKIRDRYEMDQLGHGYYVTKEEGDLYRHVMAVKQFQGLYGEKTPSLELMKIVGDMKDWRGMAALVALELRGAWFKDDILSETDKAEDSTIEFGNSVINNYAVCTLPPFKSWKRISRINIGDRTEEKIFLQFLNNSSPEIKSIFGQLVGQDVHLFFLTVNADQFVFILTKDTNGYIYRIDQEKLESITEQDWRNLSVGLLNSIDSSGTDQLGDYGERLVAMHLWGVSSGAAKEFFDLVGNIRKDKISTFKVREEIIRTIKTHSGFLLFLKALTESYDNISGSGKTTAADIFEDIYQVQERLSEIFEAIRQDRTVLWNDTENFVLNQETYMELEQIARWLAQSDVVTAGQIQDIIISPILRMEEETIVRVDRGYILNVLLPVWEAKYRKEKIPHISFCPALSPINSYIFRGYNADYTESRDVILLNIALDIVSAGYSEPQRQREYLLLNRHVSVALKPPFSVLTKFIKRLSDRDETNNINKIIGYSDLEIDDLFTSKVRDSVAVWVRLPTWAEIGMAVENLLSSIPLIKDAKGHYYEVEISGMRNCVYLGNGRIVLEEDDPQEFYTGIHLQILPNADFPRGAQIQLFTSLVHFTSAAFSRIDFARQKINGPIESLLEKGLVTISDGFIEEGTGEIRRGEAEPTEIEGDKKTQALLYVNRYFALNPQLDTITRYPRNYRYEYLLAAKVYGPLFQRRHFEKADQAADIYEATSIALLKNQTNPQILILGKSRDSIKEKISLLNQYRKPKDKFTEANIVVVGNIDDIDVNNSFDLVIVDNANGEYTIDELCKITGIFYNKGVPVLVHICSSHKIKFKTAYNTVIKKYDNVIFVHEFPEYTKLGGEPPSAVLVGSPDLVQSIRTNGALMWWFMDGVNVAIVEGFLSEMPDQPGLENSYYIQNLRLQADELAARRITVMNWNENPTSYTDGIMARLQEYFQSFSEPDIQSVNQDLEILEELARKYYNFSGKYLLLTRGTSEGIKRAMLTLLNPGDKILIGNLFYPTYRKNAAANGLEMLTYNYARRDPRDPTSLYLDVDALIEQITEIKPHLLVLINPGNPTGDVIETETFHRIMEHIKFISPNTVVVVDAVGDLHAIKKGYDYPNYNRYWDDENYNILVLNGLSKSFGITGPRCGVMMGSDKVMEKITQVLPHHSISLYGIKAMLYALQEPVLSELKESPSFVRNEQITILEKFEEWKNMDIGFYYKDDVTGNFVLFEIKGLNNSYIVKELEKMSGLLLTNEKYSNLLRASLGT